MGFCKRKKNLDVICNHEFLIHLVS